MSPAQSTSDAGGAEHAPGETRAENGYRGKGRIEGPPGKPDSNSALIMGVPVEELNTGREAKSAEEKAEEAVNEPSALESLLGCTRKCFDDFVREPGNDYPGCVGKDPRPRCRAGNRPNLVDTIGFGICIAVNCAFRRAVEQLWPPMTQKK